VTLKCKQNSSDLDLEALALLETPLLEDLLYSPRALGNLIWRDMVVNMITAREQSTNDIKVGL
jgi:hypothetical protein